jgi:hypothetical protein
MILCQLIGSQFKGMTFGCGVMLQQHTKFTENPLSGSQNTHARTHKTL